MSQNNLNLQDKGRWYGPEIAEPLSLFCATNLQGYNRKHADSLVAEINAHFPLACAYWESRPDWDSQPRSIMARASGAPEQARMRSVLFAELDRLNDKTGD